MAVLTMYDHLCMVLPCLVLMWTLVYMTMCFLSQNLVRHSEWYCRALAVVLSTTVFMMCGYHMFFMGPNPFLDIASVGGNNTTVQIMLLILCLVYFGYDLLWSIVFQTEAPVMLVHHILSIYATAYVLYRGKMASELVAIVFISELTNPLLQIRWFLYESDLHRTWYAESNTGAFIALFVLTRMFLSSYFTFNYVTTNIPDTTAKAGCAAFYAVSMVFAFNIAIYAIRHYSSMMQRHQRGVRSTRSQSNKISGAASTIGAIETGGLRKPSDQRSNHSQTSVQLSKQQSQIHEKMT